jgi:excinuclease ABC subunit C
LQYYIKRCLGPCLEGLTTPEAYRETIRDVQLFLEGRPNELEQALTKRMEAAAEAEQFETAARLRDQIVTVHQMQDKQRMAGTDNEDADVFGYHFENEMLAVNLFHMRSGKIVDRRDFFWEDLPESSRDAVTEAVAELDELEPRMEPDPAAIAPEIGEEIPIVQHAAVSELGAAFGRFLFPLSFPIGRCWQRP